MSNDASLHMKAQHLGGKPSTVVSPNLGAFMGWGILTALRVWLSNDMLKVFISPVFTYLLLLLIAIPGEKVIYGEKGAVIGAFTTMEVIIEADVSILLGTMIIAPLSVWLLRKLDVVMEPLIPAGFELLTGDLTVALSGAVVATTSCVWIALAVTSLSAVFSIGVSTLEDNNLLLLTAILIEPTEVLFLSNAVGQGVLTPFDTTQLNEFGESVLFLLGSDPGPGLDVLLAYHSFGRGSAEVNVCEASTVHLFDSIHKIYFPFILMSLLTAPAATVGGITGTFLFALFSVDLVGVSSPGSIVTIMIIASARDQLLILLAVLASTAVSFLVAAIIAKHSRQNDEDVSKNLKGAAKQMESLKGKKSRMSSMFEEKEAVTDSRTVKRIVCVYDARVGSSVMGANVIARRPRETGATSITVEHA